MRYGVLKSSLDGLCGPTTHDTLEEALKEISYFKGWDTLQQLHSSILEWGKTCRPGNIFPTRASAIVVLPAEGLDEATEKCPECRSENINFDEFSPDPSSDVMAQYGWCEECGSRWKDLFVLSQRIPLPEADGGNAP